MGVKINREKCMYCGACVSVCPANCLELKETRIKAENSKCTNCLFCVRMCPVSAITNFKELTTVEE